MRFIESRKIAAALLTVSKNLNVGMHSDVYESMWFKLGIILNSIFDSSQSGLDSTLNQEYRK